MRPRAERRGADAEDDGYVVTLVTDTNDWSSHCLIFDAVNVAVGPGGACHHAPAGAVRLPC